MGLRWSEINDEINVIEGTFNVKTISGRPNPCILVVTIFAQCWERLLFATMCVLAGVLPNSVWLVAMPIGAFVVMGIISKVPPAELVGKISLCIPFWCVSLF